MRKTIIIFIWIAFAACAYGAQKEPVSEAGALFSEGKYGEGITLLKRVLRDKTISSSQRAEVLKSQAEFYEELVGDPDEALKSYSKILETGLPDEHPIKAFADKEIARLKSLKKKYSSQDSLLKKSRVLSSRSGEDKINKQMLKLETLINENPEYYRLQEAYYFQGLNYVYLKEYRKACRLFEKCLQLKPGINFYLPVNTRAKIARTRWVVPAVKKTAWTVAGALLIITIIVFYISRPWRWLQIRHLVIGLIMIILWWLVFTISHKYLARTFKADQITAAAISAQSPMFVNAMPTSPGSKVAKYLFSYSLVAILGVFVFSIGTSRLKYRWTASLVNVIFVLLLFASLSTIFYMRYCNYPCKFISEEKGALTYLKGHLYFILSDLEPYILTNPQAYANLDAKSITDPDFREWVEQYCPSSTGP